MIPAAFATENPFLFRGAQTGIMAGTLQRGAREKLQVQAYEFIMNMEAFILGSGGTMPLPGRFLTSLLLRREGDLFLFDCGEGTQISLRKLNLRWKKISAIFVSHTHADHVTGLPGMLMLTSQVDRTEPLYIIGPPRIRDFVESMRNVLEMYINYEIIVQEITEPDKVNTVYRTEDFAVESFPLRHSRVCVGYSLTEHPRPGVFHPERATVLGVPRGPDWSRLQNGRTVLTSEGAEVHPEDVLGPPRRGRKVTYVTDSLAFPAISERASGSDLFICEGMVDDANIESAHTKRHMTAREAASIAAAAGGVKRLGLIHFSPRYTKAELRNLAREAQEVFPESFLCRDGMTIPIPFDEDEK